VRWIDRGYLVHSITRHGSDLKTTYDISNQTLGNKNTFTEPTTLQPKQAPPFTMYLSPNDMPLNKIDHVKYHLDWQNGAGTANKELPSLKTTTSSSSSSTVFSYHNS